MSIGQYLYSQSGSRDPLAYKTNVLSHLLPRMGLEKELNAADQENGCLFCLTFHPQQNLLGTSRCK